MESCVCNDSFLCMNHRLTNRPEGNSADVDLMAQNDDMSDNVTECPCHAGKICGIHVDEVMETLNKEAWRTYSPKKIERDILDELSSLRQKVADLETAKAFQVSIKDNHSMRLNDVEDKLRIMERILGGLELQRLRGNG